MGQYHKRMPALMLLKDIGYWFNIPVQELEPLLRHAEDRVINVENDD